MSASPDCWMQASSTVTQRISEDNVGQVVIIDNVDGARGVSLDPKSGTFTVEQDSDYLVVAAPQVGRENPEGSANFRCWLRVNGENVPDSNVLLNLFSVDVKDVIISQGLVLPSLFLAEDKAFCVLRRLLLDLSPPALRFDAFLCGETIRRHAVL